MLFSKEAFQTSRERCSSVSSRGLVQFASCSWTLGYGVECVCCGGHSWETPPLLPGVRALSFLTLGCPGSGCCLTGCHAEEPPWTMTVTALAVHWTISDESLQRFTRTPDTREMKDGNSHDNPKWKQNCVTKPCVNWNHKAECSESTDTNSLTPEWVTSAGRTTSRREGPLWGAFTHALGTLCTFHSLEIYSHLCRKKENSYKVPTISDRLWSILQTQISSRFS